MIIEYQNEFIRDIYYSVNTLDHRGVPKSSLKEEIEIIINSITDNASQMEWLEWNAETQLGKVIAVPERNQIPENIKEQLIVELYSK